MIEFRSTPDGLTPKGLDGFFVGWPVRPSADKHLAALRSYRVIIAVDTAAPATTSEGEPTVVGFINAISDGVATAFIPWLEVLPEYQGRGIGRELTKRMLAEFADLFSTDLTCDRELAPYYRAMGFAEMQGMGLRHRDSLID